MAAGDLLRRVAKIDSDESGSGNYHNYVAIAYCPKTDEYLLVNFTTPIGKGNPFSILIRKREFPALLKHDSEIEFRRPLEISSKELANISKKAPNGTYLMCPLDVLTKIKKKIYEGTEMARGISRKYELL